MQRVRRWAAVAIASLVGAALVVGSCGGGTLKQNGESCTASSECDVGLLCDFGREPHVCAGMSTPDSATPPDDAPPVDPDAPANDAPPVDARPDAMIDAMVDAAIDAGLEAGI